MAEAAESLYHVLAAVVGGIQAQIAQAEVQRKQLEAQPGYYYSMFRILFDTALQQSTESERRDVRKLAAILLRHDCANFWPSTCSMRQRLLSLGDEKKTEVRRAIVECCLNEPYLPTAIAIADIIASIARYDVPQAWPMLLPDLIADSADPGRRLRQTIALQRVIKRIASKRMLKDKTWFAEKSVTLFPDMVNRHAEEWKRLASSAGGDCNYLLHLAKILHHLLSFGYLTHVLQAKESDRCDTLVRLLSDIFVDNGICDQLFAVARTDHAPDEILKCIRRYDKIATDVVQAICYHPPLYDTMECLLRRYLHVAFSDPQLQSIPRKSAHQALVLLSHALSVAPSDDQGSTGKSDRQLLGQVITRVIPVDRVPEFTRTLVQYCRLAESDLELLTESEETFALRADDIESLHIDLRTTAKFTLARLAKLHRETVLKTVFEVFEHVPKLPSAIDREAAYTALGCLKPQVMEFARRACGDADTLSSRMVGIQQEMLRHYFASFGFDRCEIVRHRILATHGEYFWMPANESDVAWMDAAATTDRYDPFGSGGHLIDARVCLLLNALDCQNSPPIVRLAAVNVLRYRVFKDNMWKPESLLVPIGADNSETIAARLLQMLCSNISAQQLHNCFRSEAAYEAILSTISRMHGRYAEINQSLLSLTSRTTHSPLLDGCRSMLQVASAKDAKGAVESSLVQIRIGLTTLVLRMVKDAKWRSGDLLGEELVRPLIQLAIECTIGSNEGAGGNERFLEEAMELWKEFLNRLPDFDIDKSRNAVSACGAVAARRLLQESLAHIAVNERATVLLVKWLAQILLEYLLLMMDARVAASGSTELPIADPTTLQYAAECVKWIIQVIGNQQLFSTMDRPEQLALWLTLDTAMQVHGANLATLLCQIPIGGTTTSPGSASHATILHFILHECVGKGDSLKPIVTGGPASGMKSRLACVQWLLLSRLIYTSLPIVLQVVNDLAREEASADRGLEGVEEVSRLILVRILQQMAKSSAYCERFYVKWFVLAVGAIVSHNASLIIRSATPSPPDDALCLVMQIFTSAAERLMRETITEGVTREIDIVQRVKLRGASSLPASQSLSSADEAVRVAEASDPAGYQRRVQLQWRDPAYRTFFPNILIQTMTSLQAQLGSAALLPFMSASNSGGIGRDGTMALHGRINSVAQMPTTFEDRVPSADYDATSVDRFSAIQSVLQRVVGNYMPMSQ